MIDPGRFILAPEPLAGAREPVHCLALRVRIAIVVAHERQQLARAIQIAAGVGGPRLVPEMLQAGFLRRIDFRELDDQLAFIRVLIFPLSEADERVQNVDADVVSEWQRKEILQPFRRQAVVLILLRFLRQIDELDVLLDVGELRLHNQLLFPLYPHLPGADLLTYDDGLRNHRIDR